MKNYSERYTNQRRINAISKLEEVKQIINNLFPDIKKNKISLLLSRCAHYHYYKNQKINDEEQMLYDVLIKYGYNPYRVYKWYRLSLLPEDIKLYIENGKLTQEKAIQVYNQRMATKDTTMAWRLMEEARKVIGEVIV